MNRLGILVDVSHVSRQAMLQAAMLSRVPVVASHSCASALCDHPRNLDDTQLDALRDTGGLVQITAMPPFLRAPGGAAKPWGWRSSWITSITSCGGSAWHIAA